MENILEDKRVHELLEKADRDFALKAQRGRCEHCGGQMHRGDYPRKPRGGPDWDKRYSLCCSREGCHKLKTPPSVHFLESRTQWIPAAGGQRANAFGFGGSLWSLAKGRSGESDEVSLTEQTSSCKGVLAM